MFLEGVEGQEILISKDEGLLDWPANSLKWLARKAVEPLMLLR